MLVKLVEGRGWEEGAQIDVMSCFTLLTSAYLPVCPLGQHRLSTPPAAVVTSTDSRWISHPKRYITEEKKVCSHPCPFWLSKSGLTSSRSRSGVPPSVLPRCGADISLVSISRGSVDGPRVEDVDPVRKAGCEHQLTVRMPAVKLEKAEGKKRARRKRWTLTQWQNLSS